jgi:hypothetical protein
MNIPTEFQGNVFVGDQHTGLMEQHIYTIPSGGSAAYALSLLNGFNLQDGEDNIVPPE